MRAAVQHHLKVLEHCQTPHQVLYYNAILGAPAWLRFCAFDVILLHNTFLCLRHSRIFKFWRWQLSWIAKTHSLKVAIPQDEYDYAEVLDSWLFDLKVSVVFSNFDQAQQQLLYPKLYGHAQFYQCLTGYINEPVAQAYESRLNPLEQRAYDIVYRAKKLPYYFGSQCQLKHNIAGIVNTQAQALGLKTNISTEDKDVVLGDQWFDFLGSSRSVIGCESGSSVLDRRGEIRQQSQALLAQNPGLAFDQVAALMPSHWDDYSFFAVSPRHFEAIITKTCQVLVEGHYNGILQPEQHYISLKKDFSNLEEVLLKLKDTDHLTEITERAYQDIYLSQRYNYQAFSNLIEQAIYRHSQPPLPSPVSEGKGHLRKFGTWSQKLVSFWFGLAKVSETLRKYGYFSLAALSKRA